MSTTAQPRTVILWEHPEHDHAAWLAAGCGTGSYGEHRARLEERARAARAAGLRCLVVKTSATNMLLTLAKLGLPPGPDAFEQALRRLYLTDGD